MIKTIKLLALDVDGVLNSARERPEEPERWYDIEKDKIPLLNTIIKETECKIVFSSTWRHEFNYIGVNMFFEAIGIIPECIGCTPDWHTERGAEIAGFILKKKWDHSEKDRIEISNLCILDDDGDMDPLKDYWHWVDGRVGLTKSDVEKAIEMLNKPFNVNLQLGV